MMKIGEFAQKNNVTVRALHHYEEIGLLEPAETDRFTGYRYYDESQTGDLRIINILKSLGFSLSEITGLMKLSVAKEELILRLNEKYTQSRIELDKAQSRSLGIERLMEIVQGMPGGRSVNLKEIGEMNIFDMNRMRSQEVLYIENFERILRKAKEEGHEITTMIMDIDRFKHINDTYGHNAGDVVLDTVADTIIQMLPGGSGVLWGKTSVLERRGGDEYIIRVDCSPAKGLKLADDICKKIRELDFNDEGINEQITVSIGVANLDTNPKNSEELFHLAESALYLAKHNGRNRAEVYTEDIKEKLNSNPV